MIATTIATAGCILTATAGYAAGWWHGRHHERALRTRARHA